MTSSARSCGHTPEGALFSIKGKPRQRGIPPALEAKPDASNLARKPNLPLFIFHYSLFILSRQPAITGIVSKKTQTTPPPPPQI
jgi:hypothetical protein